MIPIFENIFRITPKRILTSLVNVNRSHKVEGNKRLLPAIIRANYISPEGYFYLTSANNRFKRFATRICLVYPFVFCRINYIIKIVLVPSHAITSLHCVVSEIILYFHFTHACSDCLCVFI